MDERHEELAALNALGMLESDEKRVLDGTALAAKDLRDLMTELEATAAELVYLVTPVEPPAGMKRRLREKLRAKGAGRKFAPSAGAVIGTIGWGLAAAFAVTALWLWNDRSKLTQDLAAASKILAPVAPPANAASSAPAEEPKPLRSLEDELKKMHADFDAKTAALNGEIAALKKRDMESQAKIAQLTAEADAVKKQNEEAKLQFATLQPSPDIWEFRRSSMVVVWDQSRDHGVLMLDRMPKVEPGKDYQLWVIDPQKPDPVSAGVVAVDSKGVVKTPFQPVEDVGEGVKFALSMEAKGGAAKRQGPVIFNGP